MDCVEIVFIGFFNCIPAELRLDMYSQKQSRIELRKPLSSQTGVQKETSVYASCWDSVYGYPNDLKFLLALWAELWIFFIILVFIRREQGNSPLYL